MDTNKLRHMSRRELLEIIYALQEREQELNGVIEKLQAELDDKNIAISKAGSIAEAACELNGIFQKAQDTADQYLNSVYNQYLDAETIIRRAQKKAEDIIASAKKEAENITMDSLDINGF